MLDLIVEQSNLYAKQKDDFDLNTDRHEIEQFLGVLLQMGIVQMPAVHMYWANETRHSLIAETMTRNRFQTLLKYFHLADNELMPAVGDSNYDKLYKVRPMIDSLKSAMHAIPPEEHHSVDEQMIPFKGRSAMKQYMPKKPHKWGYKVLTRAGHSGIMYDFEIYVGQGTCPETGLGFSGDIVYVLAENLPEDMNFKIYADNFFSSIDLCVALRKRDIFYTGTIRSNRIGTCNLKSEADLKAEGRGSYDYCTETSTNTALVRWYDSKAITLVSSHLSFDPIDSCRRFNASQKQFETVPRPYIVQQYNKFMGGVDLMDMLLELYRIDIRSVKWYFRIILWCLSVAVVNSWLIHRRHKDQRGQTNALTLVKFQSIISLNLLKAGKETLPRKRGRPAKNAPPSPIRRGPKKKTVAQPVDGVRYDNVSHWPDLVKNKARCRQCQATTQVECQKCNVKLCLTSSKNCFVDYHTSRSE